MLTPKLQRFLSRQQSMLLKLDESEKPGRIIPQNLRPTIVGGRHLSLNELMYQNAIGWLDSAAGMKATWDETVYLEANLREDTLSTDLGTFVTSYLPIIRRIHANLFAADLVSVQPLSGPSGYVFYLNKKYGDTYGAEGITDGDRTDEKFPTTYAKSGEKGTIRELDSSIQQKLIETDNYKLNVKWTLESEQDCRSQYKIDLVSELSMELGDEIAREIDRLIVMKLYAGAAINFNWNKAGKLGGGTDLTADAMMYRKTLYTDAIVTASNYILSKKYVPAAWMVMNATTFNYIARLEEFKLDPNAMQSLQTVAGMNYVGSLAAQWRVYIAPWFTDNKILMGTAPQNWLTAAGVYAPYIPLFISPEYLQGGGSDFSQKFRGAMTRFWAGIIPDEYNGTTTNSVVTITITSS